MKSYKDLDVWKLAIDQIAEIYRLTASFPKEELYGLASQMRRAAVSIASNIAEGAGRGTRKDYAHFITLASGSCCELETQIIISQRLAFLPDTEYQTVAGHNASIGRMLNALHKSLRNQAPAQR